MRSASEWLQSDAILWPMERLDMGEMTRAFIELRNKCSWTHVAIVFAPWIVWKHGVLLLFRCIWLDDGSIRFSTVLNITVMQLVLWNRNVNIKQSHAVVEYDHLVYNEHRTVLHLFSVNLKLYSILNFLYYTPLLICAYFCMWKDMWKDMWKERFEAWSCFWIVHMIYM